MVSPWTNADSHDITNSPLAVYLDRTVAVELPTGATTANGSPMSALANAHDVRAAFLRTAMQILGELVQCLLINIAFELDDRLQRNPVVVPAPGIELGFLGSTQVYIAIAADQAQQVPNLLLTLVVAAPVAAYPLLGYFVAQPVARAPEYSDVMRV